MKSISSSKARFSSCRSKAQILGVPGPAAGVGVGRVDDAEQVLQAELLVVLGVVPRALDVEEQVAVRGLGQGQEPPVGQQGTRLVPFRIQKLVTNTRLVLAGHLQTGLQPGTRQGIAAGLGTAGQHGQ